MSEGIVTRRHHLLRSVRSQHLAIGTAKQIFFSMFIVIVFVLKYDLKNTGRHRFQQFGQLKALTFSYRRPRIDNRTCVKDTRGTRRPPKANTVRRTIMAMGDFIPL